jgi:2-dehydro-3-deoxyphosphogluconate aldolase/(4S)-4-hydroxy-2-oxoglutarate aldolase
METQFGIRNLLADHPLIPVVNITNIDDVEGILDELIEKDIHCIEITLRSDCAIEAIEKALAIKPEQFTVGVGTIVSQQQITECVSLGVDFMVSPGLTKELGKAFDSARIPFLPGVMTPSEITAAVEKGYDTLKLFPFNLAGGVRALKTYASVFPAVMFCPTGGIKEEHVSDISQISNVISIGGSWLVG